MISEEVEKKYKSVQTVLDDALVNANSIELLGDKENVELSEIRKTLELLNNEFKNEIAKLESSSEWDKFCIAFFGETNAGKSTIIETLRIIYDEETRRAEAMAQKNEYHNLMVKHCEDYQGLITSLEEVNASLKIKQNKVSNWIFYFITGAAGVAAGLLLANLGIGLW
jgi:hypothetical protein